MNKTENKHNRENNETKSWFFVEMKKNDKPLAKKIKKRKRTQTISIKNDRREHHYTLQLLEGLKMIRPLKWGKYPKRGKGKSTPEERENLK